MARKSRRAETAVIAPKLFRAGLYARLSVEDLRKKQSDSIGTQVELLRRHVSAFADIVVTAEYKDINQSGTNFDRPGFNQMLADIRANTINCVVVKDLSRFGRNHIETGHFLEHVFPQMGVRFISVGDDYDSQYPDDGLIIPLKNLINEAYAKDISKKLRSKFQMKRKKGEFCGTIAPYGYVVENKRLAVDSVSAGVVRRIFSMVVGGYSDYAIAAKLNSEGVFPPKRYLYEKGLLKSEKYKTAKLWYKSVVKRITENPAYIAKPAIIDHEIFDAVTEIRAARKQIYEEGILAAKRSVSAIAIYLRLSADDGIGESESISGQRDLIYDFLASHAEFHQCKIIEFVDDGWSGTDFNRPAVKELLDLVRSGGVNCIIVKDFSRFGRNYIEVGDYLEQIFPLPGVRFISVNDRFDSQKQPRSAGSLDVTFKNLLNEMYSKDISKKVKSAKYAKMEKGELMWGCPPYGYSISKERELIIDPVAAVNVRRIFALFTSGIGTTAIASLFNEEQIPTRSVHLKNIGYKCTSRGSGFWTQESIASMLRDETYEGTYTARRTTVAKVGSAKKIPLPREQWIILRDNHDAIVDKEIFSMAQARFGKKSSAQRKKQGYLLSGKIICGHCKRAFSRREPKTQCAYFVCISNSFANCGCSRERLLESELHETVLYAIKKQAETVLCQNSVNSELKSYAAEAVKKIRKEISAFKISVDKLKQLKIRLYENYRDGKISKELFLVEKERVEQKILGFISRIEENKQRLERSSLGNKNQFEFKDFADAPCLTAQMVQVFVSAVYIFSPNSIKVEWNFADDFEGAASLVLS
ncbi:MAG: recombinase family protein [Defluviitaleaceae bacterium]|nr:recombinase family protein [Defluviitaleaceae bacterium]